MSIVNLSFYRVVGYDDLKCRQIYVQSNRKEREFLFPGFYFLNLVYFLSGTTRH